MISEIKYEELPSYEIGFEEGEKRGELKAKKMIISNLLKKGMDIKTIANLIEISEEEIKK